LESRDLAAALNKAGVVLMEGDTVYLRPSEIAAMVMQVRLTGVRVMAQLNFRNWGFVLLVEFVRASYVFDLF
jgi:hypothetical protein